MQARTWLVGIETWVNGLKVCRFNAATTTHPKFDRDRAKAVTNESGAIGLQVHGGKNWQAGDRVHWKDIRIREIRSRTDSSASNRKTRKRKPAPPDLVSTPLVPTDISKVTESTKRLDIFLLMGQSNMKGRGVMPADPLNDSEIVMMHKRSDGFFLARHPIHLVGDPADFSGADNAGVGPGLAFATSIRDKQPETRVLLIPCAVGGTAIGKWQKGQRLYDETIRRAKLALEDGPEGTTQNEHGCRYAAKYFKLLEQR